MKSFVEESIVESGEDQYTHMKHAKYRPHPLAL